MSNPNNQKTESFSLSITCNIPDKFLEDILKLKEHETIEIEIIQEDDTIIVREARTGYPICIEKLKK